MSRRDVSPTKLICENYLKYACPQEDDVGDEINSTIELKKQLDSALAVNKALKKQSRQLFRDDARLNARVSSLSKQCNTMTHECQKIRHELELDQYLDKMITGLDNYGKSIKLVAYPYKHGPSRFSELRRRFTQLLKTPKSTESDTAVMNTSPN